MPIDLAILHAIDAPLPPEPPRIAQEQVLLSKLGQTAEKLASRLVSSYEAQAEAWLSQLAKVVDEYRFAGPVTADGTIVRELDDAIGAYTEVAETRAKTHARAKKKAARDVKAEFKSDPSLGAVRRAAVTKILSVDDRVIQGLLNYITFLRAVRAGRDPDAKLGPVFDKPNDLRTALAHHLGAA